MLAHDKALALSAVETELLRDLRSRLNRPASDKAAVVLLNGVFQTAPRVGLEPSDRVWATADADAFRRAAGQASLTQLRGAVAGLVKLKGQEKAIVQALADGLPQAVLSRRLALAGREPAIDPGVPAS
ncbi:hypothetical protein QO010_001352 [Caulobacter ginsengisoli]|uniref:DUF2267 domain-containing protein n=1 Tax=Caulobacter ginsengisoli TaxID=400775 RepID=A0ABU0INK3_9CAUL|nr:hypothetical protein [Caulobacter ginsengisoli]MDQ0463581.1 hypothetical protein [Caulobacter ginsengisoli]